MKHGQGQGHSEHGQSVHGQSAQGKSSPCPLLAWSVAQFFLPAQVGRDFFLMSVVGDLGGGGSAPENPSSGFERLSHFQKLNPGVAVPQDRMRADGVVPGAELST